MNATTEELLNAINLPGGVKAVIILNEQPRHTSSFEPSFPPPPDHWYYDLTGLTLRGARSMFDDMEWAATVLRRLDEFRFDVRVMMDGRKFVDRTEVFDVRQPPRGWWTWSAAVPRRRYRPSAA